VSGVEKDVDLRMAKAIVSKDRTAASFDFDIKIDGGTVTWSVDVQEGWLYHSQVEDFCTDLAAWTNKWVGKFQGELGIGGLQKFDHQEVIVDFQEGHARFVLTEDVADKVKVKEFIEKVGGAKGVPV